MLQIRSRLVLAGILVIYTSSAWSQSAQNEEPPIESTEESVLQSDSVLVEEDAATGRRPIEQIMVRAEQTIMAIRFQLREAEEAMFARFNELNSRDEFDIECRTIRQTRSYIPRRECEPRFLSRERQGNAIQVITQLRDGGAPGGGGLGGANVAGGESDVATGLNLDAIDAYGQDDSELKSLLGQKYEEMNQEMFRLASENPDFLRALMRVEAYREALVEARAVRFDSEK